ncbi:MAG: formate dehydrogenase accessory sulfurtransferase FdhD [Candidatus Aminicenantes bacterium]|nr:formate dehydrogenase accessory sulfurtransferase FdhD [Candidatus Aminicenantes bacterium]
MTISKNRKNTTAEKRREIGLVALPEEMLLTITVNGRNLSRLSCSPFGQRELVMGWLFSQDIIGSRGDIASLCLQGTRALVRLRPGRSRQPEQFNPLQVTACSGGELRPELLEDFPSVCRVYEFTLAHAVVLMEQLPAHTRMFRKHGGIHCSMLADMNTKRLLVSREDIGRSNSVDKVVGWGLSRRINFSATALLTTGRISAEMALKCLHAGIPALISQTTLTTKALEIVRRSGLTLVGHVLKPRPILLNF